MKMYKIEVYIIDDENYGVENYLIGLRQDITGCIKQFLISTSEIGEWNDDWIINQNSSSLEQVREFHEKNVIGEEK